MSLWKNYFGLGPVASSGATPTDKETPARSLPVSWYTSQELYELERRAIFSRKWLLTTHVLRLPNTGDWIQYKIAGYPFVLVKDRQQLETPFGKPTEGDQRPPQVARSDEEHVRDPIRTQDAANLLDQLWDAVPDPGVAELPEIGEVLADLGVGEAERLTKLTAGDRLTVVLAKGLELSQVEAQPPDRRDRDVLRFGHGT